MEKNGLAVRITAMRSVGVALEVKLRECVTCKPLSSANEAAHSGLEILRRCQQTSNIGTSVVPQIRPMRLSKFRNGGIIRGLWMFI